MNIIYLLFHGLSPYSGISKKILHQWETGVFAVVRIGRYFHRYFNSGFPQFAEQPDGERICIMERAYID